MTSLPFLAPSISGWPLLLCCPGPRPLPSLSETSFSAPLNSGQELPTQEGLSTDSGTRQPGANPDLNYFSAVWHGARDLTSLPQLPRLKSGLGRHREATRTAEGKRLECGAVHKTPFPKARPTQLEPPHTAGIP